jgi:AcrR family transcriptional regulator
LSIDKAQKPAGKLAEKAAQTRARLIKVTQQLMLTEEFEKLSLETIAREAGVTTGAIYGHFGSKHGLLMAIAQTRPAARPEMFEWPKGRKGTPRQRLRRLGRAIIDHQAEAVGLAGAKSAMKFLAYAFDHEDMHPQVGAMGAMSRKAIEQRILDLFEPEELPMPVASFALLLAQLIPGMLVSRSFDPNITDETVLAMFEGLAGS